MRKGNYLLPSNCIRNGTTPYSLLLYRSVWSSRRLDPRMTINQLERKQKVRRDIGSAHSTYNAFSIVERKPGREATCQPVRHRPILGLLLLRLLLLLLFWSHLYQTRWSRIIYTHSCSYGLWCVSHVKKLLSDYVMPPHNISLCMLCVICVFRAKRSNVQE